jgi:nitrate/TMAO reductase-like tetraheme cytochrome c subunit
MSKLFCGSVAILRTKALAIIIIGFVIPFAFCSIAIAANDTPHNASNNISCGSCHGEGLLQSFWGGSGKYSTVDELCLSCHKETTGGPYADTNAPFERTHSSQNTSTKYGTWTRECRNCHNPHYQRQKIYKNIDAGNLYLATGKIQSCVYSGKDPLTTKDISTFTYESITYKSGWEWNPPTNTKLVAKTGDYRGTILFPNVGKLGYNYPITAVDPDAKTITVNGELTTECTNGYFSSTTCARHQLMIPKSEKIG